MKEKNKKEDLHEMLIGPLGASLLGNLLTEGAFRAGKGTFRAGKSTIRTGQNF